MSFKLSSQYQTKVILDKTLNLNYFFSKDFFLSIFQYCLVIKFEHQWQKSLKTLTAFDVSYGLPGFGYQMRYTQIQNKNIQLHN